MPNTFAFIQTLARMLSEDDIKRIFPVFLKDFYLHRYDYMPGSEKVTTDNISQDGLIADGQFSFVTPEGRRFVSTFEATSADKAGEVKYSLNIVYFLWDCIAFGSIVAATSYAAAYVFRLDWLVQLGWVGNVGYLMGTGLVGFLLWYFTMYRWRKYRYIYAIEQFKRYYANEQWIALADDVFPSPTDPYLEELRNQCIYHGFGLALVPADGKVRVLVSPSRLGIYGKDRRMIEWITGQDWYKVMTQNIRTIANYPTKWPGPLTKVWNRTARPLQYLLLSPVKKIIQKTSVSSKHIAEVTWSKYMSGQSIQKWITSLALFLISAMVYLVFTYHETTIEDIVERYEENPENVYILPTPDDLPNPNGIPKQYPEYPEHSKITPNTTPSKPIIKSYTSSDIPTINLSGIEEESGAQKDSCNLFDSIRGWIIVDNRYVDRDLAERRAEILELF